MLWGMNLKLGTCNIFVNGGVGFALPSILVCVHRFEMREGARDYLCQISVVMEWAFIK